MQTHLQQVGNGHQVPWRVASPAAARALSLTTAVESISSSDYRITRGDRVLHEECGFGRVLQTPIGSEDSLTVEFSDGIRQVSPRGLRRLLPRTVVARLIESRTRQVTAWAVRKADEQGSIRPDVRGHFAGHNVSYYDVARIPELIEQLSQQDEWDVSTLVINNQFGVGRIVACGPLPKSPVSAKRFVQFISHSLPLHVPVRELRHLLPANIMAKRIGVNRKSFTKLASLRGIQPEYVSSDGRTGNYYDEGRIDEIRRCWVLCSEAGRRSGGFVLDDDGEVARLKGWNGEGKAILQYLAEPGLVRTVDAARVRKLISVRALARSEQMSRYKLNRLLAVAGVHPAYRTAKTIYYEPGSARQRLKMRLDREGSGVTLRELSDRTNVSTAMLARKVRQGCILTLSSPPHVFDEQEAQRVDQIVRGLHESYSNLQTLGVARWRRRGRSAQEVASWDLSRLIEVAQSLPSTDRRILFDQVAWMCEGAGQKRFGEALDRYFVLLLRKAGSEDQRLSWSRAALLSLAKRLPNGLAVERTRLALIASGTYQFYRKAEQNLRALARETGCETEYSYDLFRTRLDRKLADFLLGYCSRGSLEGIECLSPMKWSGYAEDDLLPGAVIVSVTDRKPDVGVILSIIQQSWNAVAGCWDKRILVRFADGERCINPYAQKLDANHRNPRASAVVLVSASESGSLFQLIRSVIPGFHAM